MPRVSKFIEVHTIMYKYNLDWNEDRTEKGHQSQRFLNIRNSSVLKKGVCFIK